MTGQDLVTRALVLSGRLGQGRTPGTSESGVGLTLLNALLESGAYWSYATLTEAVTAGTAEYSLDSRPVAIEQADFTTTAGSHTTSLAIGLDAYNAVPNKYDTTPFPRAIYCDYGDTAKVYIAPLPTAGSLRLKVWAQLAAIATLATDVTLPLNVERALVANLAIDCCTAFGLQITKQLEASATDARAALAALVAAHQGAKAA